MMIPARPWSPATSHQPASSAPTNLSLTMADQEGRDLANVWWTGAAVLTMAGALLFWGGRVFEVESLYVDSSALLGLALVLAGLACL